MIKDAQTLDIERRVGFSIPVPSRKFPPVNGLSVAVVGGGFAGLMAAFALRSLGFAATIFEARPDVGGRVCSRTNISKGRVIETGAELIGVNHPVWLYYARSLGLGLSVLTSNDQFSGAGLQTPRYFHGRAITGEEADQLDKSMDRVLEKISTDAQALVDPYEPWKSPGAPEWDSRSVSEMLQVHGVDPGSTLWDALAVLIVNNQAVPLEQQSYLGLLAGVRGGALPGDPGAFWTQSEVYRCASGNQQLAHSLRALLVDADVTSVKTSTPVTALEITSSGVTVGTGTGSFQSDYAVLAIPQPTWKQLQISPAIPGSYLISTGPAVKYLSPLTSRFWLANGLAPGGSSDELGMTWEGTDNQMIIDDYEIELTTFAGGPWAEMALTAPDKVAYFTPRLETMFQGRYEQHLAAPAVFVPWPEEKWTRCGYSCPAPGEVMSAAPLLVGLYEGRLVFAGEHTVMAMFGYMEGALQSGLLAAGRILKATEHRRSR